MADSSGLQDRGDRDRQGQRPTYHRRRRRRPSGEAGPQGAGPSGSPGESGGVPPRAQGQGGSRGGHQEGRSRPEPVSQEVLQKIEDLTNAVRTRMGVDLSGLDEFLRSTRKLIVTNFFVGLSRGVGFLLGVTLVGGSIVWLSANLFDRSMHALKKDMTVDGMVQKVADIRSKLISAFEAAEVAPSGQVAPGAVSGARPTPTAGR